MGRKKNPKRQQAQKLWLESKKKRKLKDIAAELGVSEGLVRKWKCEDEWDKSSLRKINGEQVVCVTKARGAPLGNKNALGAGAPDGNKNAVKTGEFENIFFDTLGSDELYMIDNVTLHKKELLLNEIKLLTVRERRMMQRLDKFKGKEGQSAEVRTSIDLGIAVQTVKSNPAIKIIQSIEEALTRIQAQKRQCIDLLDKIERGEMECW
ncbi:phage terminase small subunit [Paludicola sp. MB14-C6]|uniref:phage terminase small subunit n=1 Tax=Paludihabitans sp. MB14-C6 TaxID=3070656 RepID=UPI0027DBA023|nr:phage terminase small subunit [Paludicola sp. MB14-C6]WMJ23468.1 phage terminase small subunit [Paludicola sp. MB14-C6]